jgi:hypothetical protein
MPETSKLREVLKPFALGDAYRSCKTISEVTWNKETSYVTGEFIEWPHPESLRVANSINISTASLSGWSPPILKDKLLEAHLWRLKYQLEWWWQKVPHSKVISPSILLKRNLLEGPAFAEELDDSLKYSYRYNTSRCIVYSENWDAPIFEDAWGIDSFFPPAHLLPFKMEDPGDIELTFSTEELDISLVERFKREARKHIKEEVILPRLDDVDRLSLFGSTKTFEVASGKSKTRSEGRFKDPSLKLTDRFMFKYVFVQKTAAEGRAAVICEQETLNTMRLLKKSLEAVRDNPYDSMGTTDFSWLPYWLSDSTKTYLMSDQKKCGLTFPRSLLIALLEVLDEFYPNSVFRKGIDGYKNSRILMPDGSWRHQVGGVNLGMMNEYVSFIMSILVASWIEENELTDVVDAYMYNDDQVIRFDKIVADSIDEMLDWGKSWDLWMGMFNISVHTKKPFWSDRGCFLETYGRPDYGPFRLRKISQYVGNIFWCLLASNIVEAKEFVSSIVGNLPEYYLDHAREAVGQVMNLWGYEFGPFEAKYSFPIGWVKNVNDDGLYTLLDEIYSIPAFGPERGLLDASIVPKPRKWNKQLRTLAKDFRGKKRWFFDLLSHPSSPPFIQRIAETLDPPYQGIRGDQKRAVYHEWYNARQAAFKKPLEDYSTVVLKLLKEHGNAKIPEDLLSTKRRDSAFSEEFLEAPELPQTVRDWFAFSQWFGINKDIFVDKVMSDEEVKEYASKMFVPNEHSGTLLGLASSISKKSLSGLMENMSQFGGAPIDMLRDEYFYIPSFIPGWGDIVCTHPFLKGAFRVPYETLSSHELSFGEDAPFVAFLECNNHMSAELINKEHRELLELFHEEHENIRNAAYLASLRDVDTTTYPVQDPEMIMYFKHMIHGVMEGLRMQADPESRQEYFDTFLDTREEAADTAAALGFGETPDVWGDDSDGSEDGMLGMFG